MKNKYPDVIDEDSTILRMSWNTSISRYGDGEFRIALGGYSISQKHDSKLQDELLHILKVGSTDKCLVGIVPINDPNIKGAETWNKRAPTYIPLLNPKATYYSSFVSRPDNFIESIGNKSFYTNVVNLWCDKDVILVASIHPTPGEPTSLRENIMPEAKSVQMIIAPYRDSYAEIDRIEAEIGKTDKPVLLCLGATATVLSWRLANKGILAWDLGHIGIPLNKFQTKTS